MTVSYIEMHHDGSTTIIKCFYEQGSEYGEFFVELNEERKTLEFRTKDEYYKRVLVEAFAQAMSWPTKVDPEPQEETA